MIQKQPSILVIGDVILDHYISGTVDRISPEAPVPVVKVNKEWSSLGGAGNVAANVASLNGNPILIGMTGRDSAGAKVTQFCKDKGINACFIDGSTPTISKTRVISGQQIVRVDREESIIWDGAQLKKLSRILGKEIQDCACVLLSDYGKGTLSDVVLKQVMTLAVQHGKKVLIDPKRTDWSAYSGAYLLSPNLKELAMAVGLSKMENDDNTVVKYGKQLRLKHDIENLLCTRSSYGMTLMSKNKLLNIPTKAQEVFDVSGAGDTVLATLGIMLANGKSLSESAFAANAAAGVVVSKLGTATVSLRELDGFREKKSKLIERGQVSAFMNSIDGKKVVFTNGCFDVLHHGHRSLLKEAKELGDVLVVALNSDTSISRLKGADRPINPETERIEAISALPFVDKVVVFEEDTPLELLTEMKPNVLVKGGDYKPDEVVGAKLVDKVVIVDLVKGVSTSNFFA